MVVAGFVVDVRIALLGLDVFFRGVRFVVIVSDEARMVARWQCNAFATSSSGTHTMTIVGVTVGAATPRGLVIVRDDA
jgi:hypothetical protein